MKTSKMIESKYLTKDDAGLDGTVVTVKDFERVNMAQEGKPPEYKWVMWLREFEKPMVMNGTNIQLAEKALASEETDDWIGKQIIIYDDPNVSFGKELVGGLRIRAHRKAAPPRQIGDDFGDDPQVKEQELRDAALNGTDALKRAWTGLTDPMRETLRPKLAALKDLAANPKPPAVDKLDDDIPF